MVQTMLKIEYDAHKSHCNELERGLSFDLVHYLDWDTATIDPSDAMGEARYKVVGYIDKRLHVVIVTRCPGVLRVISLRKANLREIRRYENDSQPH